jgi:endonuclease/exonuclease/phosphatase family metal-dependent hydrolase
MVGRRIGIACVVMGALLLLGTVAIPTPDACPKAECRFAPPTGVRGVASTASRLQVTWADVPKAFAYRVQLAPKATFTGEGLVTTTKQEPRGPRPLIFTGLRAGRPYFLRVSVIDRDLRQQSRWSTPVAYATKGSMRFSVGTYNIHNPDETWGKRGPAVADALVSEKLKLVGIQEAYRKSERRSLLGYVNNRSRAIHGGAAYRMAPAVDSDLGYDNRILYDTRVVTLIGAGGRKYKHQEGGDEVDRWFAWATFRHRASGWKVLFVTTHLAPHNPRMIRKQWDELIDRIDSLRRTYNIPWVVVAGDLNTTKFDKPADDLLEVMHKNGYGDVLGQKYRSYDTDNARAKVTKDAWLDSFNDFDPDIDHYDHHRDNFGNSFDWIFASNALAVPYYRVVARYDGNGMLAEPIPSDHFLVRATLAYEPQLSEPRTRIHRSSRAR